LWLTALSFLPLHGAGVACQSIFRWPRSGQALDTEALRLPQGNLVHSRDPLPPQCAWLSAGASWHVTPQKEVDAGKAISGQQGGQREKALGSSPSQGLERFVSGRVSIGLTVSYSHGQCLNTAFCVWMCFQGVI